MELKEIQELKEKFRAVQSQYLLCKYKDCYKNTNLYMEDGFIQVILEAISEESNFVVKLSYTKVFDVGSNGTEYFVKSDFFNQFIYNDLKIDMDQKNVEEKKEILSEYLNDKIIILKPFYYHHEGRDVFYKNGTIAGIISINGEIPKIYDTIPVVRNENFYESLVNKEEFPLYEVTEELKGIPDYLFYEKENIILKVNLKSNNPADCFWYVDSDEYGEIKLDYDEMEKDYSLIKCDGGNFIFVDDNFLTKKAKIERKKFEKKTKNEDTSSEDLSYDYSENDKELLSFFEYTKNAKLSYSKDDIYNFYTCICSSQLIILEGMSGTGKTKLPLKFADFFNMTEENNKLLFLPVSPAYTEPSDILGYLNPNTGVYNSSETRLVEFLKHAEDNENEMHMVIFDEMNLSQIEFWFAPFISILEKDTNDRYLHLYSDSQRCINSDKYPAKIKIGNNIIFIGTINLDETTKNISARLLDRSYVINLKKSTFATYYAEQSNLSDKNESTEKSKNDFKTLMPKESENEAGYITRFNIKQLEFFDRLHAELNNIDRQSGVSFRSVKNIALYLKNKPNDFDSTKAFDYVFKQTILRKISGSIESIGKILGVEENGMVNEKENFLIKLFDDYSEISDFRESRLEVNNKVKELVRYGYTR